LSRSSAPEIIGLGEALLVTCRLVRELRSGGVSLSEPSENAVLCADFVVALPGWVARFGPLSDGKQFWLYCEPGGNPDPAPAGQVLFRLPPGRYMIDTFDLGSGDCVSRESAVASPLVAGLTFTGHPVLLWLRPC
jgi:hypothetical protein